MEVYIHGKWKRDLLLWLLHIFCGTSSRLLRLVPWINDHTFLRLQIWTLPAWSKTVYMCSLLRWIMLIWTHQHDWRCWSSVTFYKHAKNVETVICNVILPRNEYSKRCENSTRTQRKEVDNVKTDWPRNQICWRSFVIPTCTRNGKTVKQLSRDIKKWVFIERNHSQIIRYFNEQLRDWQKLHMQFVHLQNSFEENIPVN